MQEVLIRISISNQSLKLKTLSPIVAKSQNYALCEFDLNDVWIADDITSIVCQFKTEDTDTPYEISVENNQCLIPWEVLQRSGTVLVSCCAYAGENCIITTNTSKFSVYPTKYTEDVVTPSSPTPSRIQALEQQIELINQALINLSQELDNNDEELRQQIDEALLVIEEIEQELQNYLPLAGGTIQGELIFGNTDGEKYTTIQKNGISTNNISSPSGILKIYNDVNIQDLSGDDIQSATMESEDVYTDTLHSYNADNINVVNNIDMNNKSIANAKDYQGERMTLTSSFSTEMEIIEPLRVRDERIDLFKTTTVLANGSTTGSSIIKIDKHNNIIEFKAPITFKESVNCADELTAKEISVGKNIYFGKKESQFGRYYNGTSYTPTFIILYSENNNNGTDQGVTLKLGSAIYIMSNENSDKLSIRANEFGLQTTDDDAQKNIEANTQTTKIRSPYKKSNNTHNNIIVGDDDIRVNGDLLLYEPDVNCLHLPDDITPDEIGWLNDYLNTILLSLKRNQTSTSATVNNKQDKTAIETVDDTAIVLNPNKVYVFAKSNPISTLNIILDNIEADYVNEYIVKFMSQIDDMPIAITDSNSSNILWHNEPKILANKCYTLAISVVGDYKEAVLSYAE